MKFNEGEKVEWCTCEVWNTYDLHDEDRRALVIYHQDGYHEKIDLEGDDAPAYVRLKCNVSRPSVLLQASSHDTAHHMSRCPPRVALPTTPTCRGGGEGGVTGASCGTGEGSGGEGGGQSTPKDSGGIPNGDGAPSPLGSRSLGEGLPTTFRAAHHVSRCPPCVALPTMCPDATFAADPRYAL